MTSLASVLPTRFVRRASQFWNTLFAHGDFAALLITLALMLTPAYALGAAGWNVDLNTLVPVLALSVVFGFLLARSSYNELFALILSAIYGGSFVFIIAAINEPGGIGEGLFSVISRLTTWLIDATSGGINQDDLVFTLLVASLFWFLGYNAAWHVFRIDRVWRAILPPGLILATNAVYYTGDTDLNRYLIVFVFLALLLIVRSNLDAREWHWYVNGIRVPRRLRNQFFVLGGGLALIALLIGWGVPSGDVQDRLNRFQQFLQSEPIQQLSEFWNRLFSSVETQGPTTADYYGGDSLQLGGAIRLGEQVVFLASAPPGRRYYWRSRVFDVYDSGRWTSAADTRLTDPEVPLDVIYEPYLDGARVAVQQTFTMSLSATRILYAAPQPIRVELPTRTDLRYTDGGSMNISVIRPLRVLYRGETYDVTSLVSSATAAQLRSAATEYPAWVRNLYLPYMPSVTPRTIQLAQEIVRQADARTPYDQAKAIEAWLRQNIEYNEVIPQPPVGQDPVDWVLFDYREGYCNYYASSMVVMLRSLGIPARMAAGFAQGEWNADESAYVVRERDAHTWVEVFFPGYGWVEFEPTSAQAPLTRDDEQPPLPQEPTQPPAPSLTPTITPTFTPTPTSGVPTVPPQPESNLLPSVTPSFTPSPTATPVIVPTQPPPLRPPTRDPFAFLIPAIAAVVVGIVVIVLLLVAGTLIYWWWEWRGMRGLSPITRAYARLERYLLLVGIRLNPDQTPDERRARIVRDLPAAEPPVNAITRLYNVERYGRPNSRPTPGADDASADRAWLAARTRILRRWLKRFIPFL